MRLLTYQDTDTKQSSEWRDAAVHCYITTPVRHSLLTVAMQATTVSDCRVGGVRSSRTRLSRAQPRLSRPFYRFSLYGECGCGLQCGASGAVLQTRGLPHPQSALATDDRPGSGLLVHTTRTQWDAHTRTLAGLRWYRPWPLFDRRSRKKYVWIIFRGGNLPTFFGLLTWLILYVLLPTQ